MKLFICKKYQVYDFLGLKLSTHFQIIMENSIPQIFSRKSKCSLS